MCCGNQIGERYGLNYRRDHHRALLGQVARLPAQTAQRRHGSAVTPAIRSGTPHPHNRSLQAELYAPSRGIELDGVTSLDSRPVLCYPQYLGSGIFNPPLL
jgi:hypothetical protein